MFFRLHSLFHFFFVCYSHTHTHTLAALIRHSFDAWPNQSLLLFTNTCSLLLFSCAQATRTTIKDSRKEHAAGGLQKGRSASCFDERWLAAFLRATGTATVEELRLLLTEHDIVVIGAYCSVCVARNSICDGARRTFFSCSDFIILVLLFLFVR
jgi:hypothetical protein